MIKSISSAIFSEHRPVQIIPSVLPADWANMGQCVKDLELAGVDRIQFDVMDGNFVPNLTSVSYTHLTLPTTPYV